MKRKRTNPTRRSGFEDTFESDLNERGIVYGYETETLSYKYTIPAREKTERYTPDFPLVTQTGKKIYIETKGRLTAENRKKYLRVKNLLGIDLRFVFQRPNNKIYRGSNTTYAEWCDQNGFQWAKETLPQEWLME
jgi:hypothetical protein